MESHPPPKFLVLTLDLHSFDITKKYLTRFFIFLSGKIKLFQMDLYRLGFLLHLSVTWVYCNLCIMTTIHEVTYLKEYLESKRKFSPMKDFTKDF